MVPQRPAPAPDVRPVPPARPPSAATRAAGLAGGRGFPLILAAIVMAGLAGRLLLIEWYSMSLDEAFTRYWIEQPQAFLWGEGRRIETNPPLYFSLLRAWAEAFGTTDAALRLPSALVSAACIAICGLLGRAAAGPRTGLLAAAFLAIAPFSIWHATDARPVALTPLFLLLAMLGAHRYLGRMAREREGEPFGAAARLVCGVLFAAGSAAAILTHATAVIFAATLGLATLAAVLASPRPWGHAAAWVGFGLATLLLAAPQLLVFAGQAGAPNIGWIPPFSVWMAQTFLVPIALGLGGFELPSAVRLPLAGAVLGLAALGAVLLRDRAGLAVLVAAPLAFAVAVAVISIWRPIMIPRIGLILLAPICILAAVAVLRVPLPRLGLVAGLGMVAIQLAGLALQLAHPERINLAHTLRPDYRGVARFLEATPGCRGDIHSGHAWTLFGWPHYGAPPRGARLVTVIFPQPEDYRETPVVQLFVPITGKHFITAAELRDSLQQAGGGVVLVQRTAPSSPAMRRMLEELRDGFELRQRSFERGNNEIVVTCLSARGRP